MEHQERAVRAYVESVSGDPEVIAVVIVGSVARGVEREGSDVDLYLVKTDAAFEAALARNEVAWSERHDVDYPGGYVDVKLASPSYLARAAAAGDDPTRASFDGARIAYRAEGADAVLAGACAVAGVEAAGLEDVVRLITTLPDEAWDERVRGFIAAARLHGRYFLGQACERGDRFLASHAAVHTAFAAARAALAVNRVLLQGPKYIARTTAGLPDAPDGFSEALEALVTAPDAATGERVVSMLEEWSPVELDRAATLSTFIRDNELAWLRGTVPVEYS